MKDVCKHTKHKITEREFYTNQKNPYSGTRIICLKCGADKFIKDEKYGKPTTKLKQDKIWNG